MAGQEVKALWKCAAVFFGGIGLACVINSPLLAILAGGGALGVGAIIWSDRPRKSAHALYLETLQKKDKKQEAESLWPYAAIFFGGIGLACVIKSPLLAVVAGGVGLGLGARTWVDRPRKSAHARYLESLQKNDKV